MGSLIQEFYREKSIFITGGTGFIGKVLCEKFLRSCPDIGNIYVLLRSRREKTAEQRLHEELLTSPVFTLNNNNDLKLDKIIAVSGDISRPGLGMSDEDREKLMSEVSVVFHSAASVKFHGPIKDFIVQNVFGTQAVMQLCAKMTKLEALVYVSTAYANCGLLEIEEKVYKLSLSATDTINKINSIDDGSGINVDPLTMQSLMEGRPNSYTFSKAVAENLVTEKYYDLPVVIVRPSIVTPALEEPAPGWVDNVNGVAGALLLGALGIARTMEVNCDIKADLIPVDIISNSLIVIGWHTATQPNDRKQVIHLTSGTENPVTWGRFLDYSREAALKAPSIRMVRPLAKNPTSSKGPIGRLNHILTKFLSHIMFAYTVDTLLTLLGYQRLMVKVTQKMHRAFIVLEHFTNKEWCFHNDNYYHIHNQLSKSDQKIFSSDIRTIDWRKYAGSLYLGTRRYLLKEDDSTIDKAKKRLSFITLVYNSFKIISSALIMCFIFYLFMS